MQELVDNNEIHFADAGGFVSPNGTSYIGVSKQKLGQVRGGSRGVTLGNGAG